MNPATIKILILDRKKDHRRSSPRKYPPKCETIYRHRIKAIRIFGITLRKARVEHRRCKNPTVEGSIYCHFHRPRHPKDKYPLDRWMSNEPY